MTNALNLSIIEGRLVRIPELKKLNNGINFCKLDLAVNEFPSRKDGKSNATFISATIWGKVAEMCSKYLSKGQKVRIKGKLRQSCWQGKDGTKHSRLEINATNVDFLEKAKKTQTFVDQTQAESVPF